MSWQDRPYSDHDGPDMFGPPRGGGGGMHFAFPPLTPVVRGLLIANVAIFIIRAILKSDWLGFLGEMDATLVVRGQIWRVVTYQYLHSQQSVMHLIFNMIGLYFLGTTLERHWGAKRFFTFYTVAGVLGGIFYTVVVLLGWLRPLPMVGASGCVLGLLGACAVLFPNIMLIIVFFPVPIRFAAALFIAIYVLNLISRGANAGGDAAHLAGLAFGILWPMYGHRLRIKFEKAKSARVTGAWERKMLKRAQEARHVDEILKKVHEHGIGSLTAVEKRTLEQASKQQRSDDQTHGRVDRI